MHVIDPETGAPVDDAPNDAASAAAAAAPEPAPEPTEAEALTAAMDAGIAVATPEAAPVEAAVVEPIPGAEQTQEQKGVAASPEQDKAVEDEIAGFALKGKAEERFRDMATQIKELAPIKAQLDAAGVKDLADLPKMIERSKAADDMIAMVMDTGASADQYGQALEYMRLVNSAVTGDRAAAEKAYDVVAGELAALAKVLGKEVPGVHDPLAEHADLAADIASGDLSRQRALEIAASRTQGKLAQVHEQTATEQRQASVAAEQGKVQLGQFDQQMLASDPSYAGKREILSSLVASIRQNLPPAQWLAATQQAYASIPTIPAPALPAKPAPGPVRPSGPRPVMTQTVYDDPLAALEAGIAATL